MFVCHARGDNKSPHIAISASRPSLRGLQLRLTYYNPSITMRPTQIFLAATVVIALAAAQVWYFWSMVPLLNRSSSMNLSTTGYDIVVMDAPVATGTMLHALARLFALPQVGPLLTRFLINNNNVWHVRELAAQLPQAMVFKPLPTYSIDADTLRRHQAAAYSDQSKLDGKAPKRRGDHTYLGVPQLGQRLRSRDWSLSDYARAYQAKSTTPTAITEALLEARKRLEAQLGAIFTEVHDDLVLQQALDSTRRWEAGSPLSIFDGVPVAVKEMIDIANHTTASGTRRSGGPDDQRARVAQMDDPIVARFRALGALIIGQAVMTEYGVTPLGWSMHAQGPSNPYNSSHYSGGSSSGSAVAVATGLVPLAIGFDGGGSIRIPAALSGVVGLACNFGRVPFVCDYASSMTHAGPLTRSIHDAALSYWVMARPPPPLAPADPEHSTTRGLHVEHAPPAHLGGRLPGGLHRLSKCDDLSGVRVGVFVAHADDATSEVKNAVQVALNALTRLGAEIVEIEIPHLMALSVAHGMLISSEFASDHDREYSNGAPLEPSTRIQLALGRVMTSTEFIAANKLRSWGIEFMTELFHDKKLDAIAGPTTGLTAPHLTPAARETGESNTALIMSLIKHIFLANLLGLPAISVPLGLGKDTHLPMGFQFLGAAWEEAKLLHLACALEESMDGNQRPPHFFHELDSLLRIGSVQP